MSRSVPSAPVSVNERSRSWFVILTFAEMTSSHVVVDSLAF